MLFLPLKRVAAIQILRTTSPTYVDFILLSTFLFPDWGLWSDLIIFRSEFTNYSHEEILDRPGSSSSTTSPKQTSGGAGKKETGNGVKERIIPIRLETGEEIMPIFTKLEEPEPPKW